MLKYKVLENVVYTTGVIGLDDEQARRRKRKLKKKASGVFEILAPTTFKKGEVVRLAKVSKYDEKRLECLDKDAPKRKRTPTKVNMIGKPAKAKK